MMKLFVFAWWLLSALSAVQMETININQRVGESVTIHCSDWGVWTNVTENVKYLCSSPCTEKRHIIIEAGYGKNKRKDQIEITNRGEVLYVTFSDLQKSDAGKYYCGLDRVGKDALIEVNVKVRDALSAVQMEAININQRVGESVTIKCSGWGVWTNVKGNVKYLCSSPCTSDRHFIIEAGYERINRKNRIEIINSGEVLYVTFSDLQKSDVGKYYCGVERTGSDPLIEVNVKVTDAEPSRPSETLKPVIVPVTTSSPVTSPYVSDVFTDMSTTNQTFNSTTPPASAAQGAGNVLLLMTAVIVTFTLLTILLLLIRKMRNKQQIVVTTPQEPAGESGAADRVYQSLQLKSMGEDQVYSRITPNNESGAADRVYQSLQLKSMDEDQVYSRITPNNENPVL